MGLHKDVTAANSHVPGYFQSGDPGAVGAGKFWTDTSTAAPYQLKVRNATNDAWEDVGSTGGAAHNLLSSTHGDTTAASVVRGDIVVAKGASPKWERLAKGTTGQVLTMGADEPAWATGGGGLTDQDKIDLAWDKKFFSDAGVLPATERVAASLATFPTPTGSPVGSLTATAGKGLLADPSMIYWDLGALRSEILMVAGGIEFDGGPVTLGFVLSSDQPTDNSPTGYFADYFTTGPSMRLMRVDGSTFTSITSFTPFWSASQTNPFGLALYYKDSTDVLKVFVRLNNRWTIVIDTTNSQYTTLRYASLRLDTTGGQGRVFLPFTVWSD